MIQLIFQGDTCQIFQLRTVTLDPAAVYFNFLFFKHSGQFFADSSQIPYMSCRFLLRRYFLHSQLPICCFTDFRINGELLISLIGKLHINQSCLWLIFSDNKKKRIGKLRVKIIAQKCIIHLRFLKQIQTESVKIVVPHMQLSACREMSV